MSACVCRHVCLFTVDMVTDTGNSTVWTGSIFMYLLGIQAFISQCSSHPRHSTIDNM